MSESSAPGTSHRSLVQISRAPATGMLVLRGDLGGPTLRQALDAATGLDVPGRREIVYGGDGEFGVAWMSPDELMVFTPPEAAQATCAQMADALAGQPALVADMSDARIILAIEGSALRDVLAKLCPVDFAAQAFEPGTIRRTRAAQAAVALWFTGAGAARLICFRSLAGYVEDLLHMAAAPGGEVGLYHR